MSHEFKQKIFTGAEHRGKFQADFHDIPRNFQPKNFYRGTPRKGGGAPAYRIVPTIFHEPIGGRGPRMWGIWAWDIVANFRNPKPKPKTVSLD